MREPMKLKFKSKILRAGALETGPGVKKTNGSKTHSVSSC